tara:strand:- start:906 stop:1331 length:426 start_codon:yes stop_codon:yes gene_type:complete
MNYQGIRAALEKPIADAYSALTPEIPVYFDNFGDVLADADSEFVYINIQFGLTTEIALTSSLDNVRGIITVRVFSEKDKGSIRNQELINTGFTTIQTLNNTGQTSTGIFIRTGEINGPTFSTDRPFFISRLETNFQATVIS